MRRIFGNYVYGEGPRAGCFWDDTCELPSVPVLDRDLSCDVAIVGAGFTGLNAALELRASGLDVVVLDANTPGWGASGRNGGFCCLGGGKIGDAMLDKRFGKAARLAWRQTESAAVAQVADFLDRTGTDVDRHSQGETWLAHRARHAHGLDAEIAAVEENYGVTAHAHSPEDLREMGLSAGFHGGLTLPVGFGLNPRKYLKGLLAACLAAGVGVYRDAPVDVVESAPKGWELQVARLRVRAEHVIVATNGYSSEAVPAWLAGRYMPAQSTVVVTRPLRDEELAAQGWTSDQMVYDSRNLLHYFRLMPDRRMLFGMRGSLGGSAASEARARAHVVRDFRKMFPAWQSVPLTHSWSGMVSLAQGLLPVVGPVPKQAGLWTAMCYHGNGVAMGSLCGRMIARCVLGDDQRPEVLHRVATRFPLGRARRLLMIPAYFGLILADL